MFIVKSVHLILLTPRESQNQELLEVAQLAGKPTLPSAFSSVVSNLVCIRRVTIFKASNVSVFVNEQMREESLHNAMLSRHVALSEKESIIRNKKAGICRFPFFSRNNCCRAFKRGNCRRGDKCRFSHYLGPPKEGSDAVTAVLTGDAEYYTDPNDVFTKRRKLV